MALKVTAAGREFEQISHWSLSKVSCPICCKKCVKVTFLRKLHTEVDVTYSGIINSHFFSVVFVIFTFFAERITHVETAGEC